jgi:hypothetical protein
MESKKRKEDYLSAFERLLIRYPDVNQLILTALATHNKIGVSGVYRFRCTSRILYNSTNRWPFVWKLLLHRHFPTHFSIDLPYYTVTPEAYLRMAFKERYPYHLVVIAHSPIRYNGANNARLAITRDTFSPRFSHIDIAPWIIYNFIADNCTIHSIGYGVCTAHTDYLNIKVSVPETLYSLPSESVIRVSVVQNMPSIHLVVYAGKTHSRSMPRHEAGRAANDGEVVLQYNIDNGIYTCSLDTLDISNDNIYRDEFNGAVKAFRAIEPSVKNTTQMWNVCHNNFELVQTSTTPLDAINVMTKLFKVLPECIRKARRDASTKIVIVINCIE